MRLTVTGQRVRRVDFKRGRQLLRRDAKAPFQLAVSPRRMRAGAVNRLRAVAYLAEGGRVVRSRPVRPCG